MRVCIAPFYQGADQADGGIRRVVEAQQRYLPDLGWDVTNNPDEADLIACHGATLVERVDVPMVCHNHGMMWEDYGFGEWGGDVNRHVIDVMVRAQAITAPSRWVAHAISRGMLAQPEVIYHGVDAEAWAHNEDQLGYVLWNKARIDPVSDPADMQAVAALLPDVPFFTTFGQPTPNVFPFGALPFEQMRPVVQRAGVYLATARETFGIGALEALAAGVPVAGWDYGGQHEIVTPGETGYLAPFGDMQALAECIRRCLAERVRLSANAQVHARERWGWKDKIARYAALYDRVIRGWRRERPKISVVITSYNLAHYLGEALTSVAEQTMDDWECLIIDDCSTDDTTQLATLWTEDQDIPHYGGGSMRSTGDRRFRYLRTPHNLGLSGARNYGWQHSIGKYVLFLDADDALAPNALDTLSRSLDLDSATHIAYGALDTISAAGSNRRRNPWPAGEFNWHAQIAHLNQIHGACLMRREVLERSGGYRVRDWRAEDASFWARVTSLGFRSARVTDDTIQIYRMHDDQKSKSEPGDGDWTAWLPWRLAGEPRSGIQAINQGRQPNPRIVPFGAQGAPPAPLKAWPVRHFQHPLISVIIPVGPGHAQYLVDALDSMQAQTFVEWECIVVNDSGAALGLAPWPWARQWEVSRIEDERAVRMGAGGARNWGLRHASAPFVVFLDADDVLHPRALEEMLKAYITSGGRYIYTDWATLEDERRIDGDVQTHQVDDYDQRAMLQGLRHAVTALIPAEWARAVGGFDERLPVFEDWDFYCKLAVGGYCGQRVAQPLLIYRHQAGLRTRTALMPQEHTDDAPRYTPLGEEVAGAIGDRYAAYLSGEELLMGCCTGNAQTVAQAADALNDMVSFATNGVAPIAAPEGGTVRMEFIGEQLGAQSFYGKGSGRLYRAGREPGSRFHDVDPRDVEHFVDLGLFRVVAAEVLALAAQADESVAVAVEPRVAAHKPKGRKSQ